MNRNLGKYFERYVDPSVLIASELLKTFSYDSVVAVPARRELLHLPPLISSLNRARRDTKVLLILVINSPLTASAQEIEEQERTLQYLRETSQCLLEGPTHYLLDHQGLNIFVFDRFHPSQTLKKGLGVGFARKLACDLAAHLHWRNQIRTQAILSTDADAIVPLDYFAALDQMESGDSLGIFSFYHVREGEGPQQQAMANYERWIHHYIEGLQYAGSPYAHPALGSIFAINAKSYVEARGFPIREAGEDFYLLNKLKKLGSIKRLKTSQPILLSGRISDRVPFGTGPGIKRLLDTSAASKIFYDQQCFESLRRYLQWAEATLKGATDSPPPQIPNHFIELPKTAKNLRDFHTRFDGIQTLKLIHHFQRAPETSFT